MFPSLLVLEGTHYSFRASWGKAKSMQCDLKLDSIPYIVHLETSPELHLSHQFQAMPGVMVMLSTPGAYTIMQV